MATLVAQETQQAPRAITLPGNREELLLAQKQRGLDRQFSAEFKRNGRSAELDIHAREFYLSLKTDPSGKGSIALGEIVNESIPDNKRKLNIPVTGVNTEVAAQRVATFALAHADELLSGEMRSLAYVASNGKITVKDNNGGTAEFAWDRNRGKLGEFKNETTYRRKA